MSDDEIEVIEILIPGIPGPPGPGGSGAAYIHTQSVASAEWIINHNIGAKPIVTVFSIGGLEVVADIVHLTANQARVYFSSPQTGSARCI